MRDGEMSQSTEAMRFASKLTPLFRMPSRVEWGILKAFFSSGEKPSGDVTVSAAVLKTTRPFKINPCRRRW